MKFNAYPYQIEAIKRIVNTSGIALFLSCGLGKTVITLSAIKILMKDFKSVKRVLVIAPKTVSEATWQTEIETWDHTKELTYSTILGTPARRLKSAQSDADIYIINRENVVWLVDTYEKDWKWDMVVLDESSSFKSHTSKRFKALKKVRSKISRVVELTGTPSPNGLEDLWAQIYLLDGGKRLGKTITKYRDSFFKPAMSNGYVVYSYIPLKGAQEEIEKRISDIAVSMKAEDYLQLPDILFNDVFVSLDKKSRGLYNKLEQEALFSVDASTVTASNAAAISGKLLQLCNGAVYAENDDGEQTVLHVHDCKLDALEELIESLHASGDNAIVCYGFIHDKIRILERLEKLYKIRVYKDANDLIDWNAGKIEILLMHPAACGYGLNLQKGGCNLIWFSLPWSLELYQQTNARLHRQGQTRPVTIHRLIVKGARDADVVTALQSKTRTQDLLIESLKARIQEIEIRNR